MSMTYLKTIRFSSGFNESGANFVFTAKINCGESEVAQVDALFSKIFNEIDHKHFNFDFPELRKKSLEPKEVLDFLILRVRNDIQFEVLEAQINRGNKETLFWTKDTR